VSVANILKGKGSDVKTVGPDVSAQEFARLLLKEGIGAMVVKTTDGSIAGIIGPGLFCFLNSRTVEPAVNRCAQFFNACFSTNSLK
jgi:hypothetical protein